MRPGSELLSSTSDDTDGPQAGSGEEVVVSEHTAAFLVRQRAAEVIEVIEQPEGNPENH